MKKTILLLFSLLLINCSTNKLIKKNIESNYFNVNFKPIELTKDIRPNLSLTVEPIDAKKLNIEIFESSKLDGSYEKSLIRSYVSQEELKESLNSSNRKKRELALSIESFLNKISSENNISEDVIINFKEKVYYSHLLEKYYGFDGTEVVSLKGNERYKILNPYNNNNKYFSLFKLTFKNTGNLIEEIELKNFQILNNNELLYPFKNQYFEDNLKGSESLKFIYRMNLPDNLRIIPNQSVVKYISVPAINTDYKKLIVNYIEKDKPIDYSFGISIETKNEIDVFTNFQILQPQYSGNFRYYYVVETDDLIFPLNNNSFFINDKDLNNPITIYRLTIDVQNHNHLIIKNRIIPSEIKGDKIKIKRE